MVQHVYERVCQSSLVNKVLIATDDERIGQACDGFGACWQMTRIDHCSGTDRIAEVVAGLKADIIVNVQGDEPEIDPDHIGQVVRLLQQDNEADMSTLASRLGSQDDRGNPNLVKVVLNNRGRALYFSRSEIPYQRNDGDEAVSGVCLRHLGLYGYRRETLLKLSKLKPGPLEQCERLEQLRALENGMTIAVGIVGHTAEGIDTAEQYDAFVLRRFKKLEDGPLPAQG